MTAERPSGLLVPVSSQDHVRNFDQSDETALTSRHAGSRSSASSTDQQSPDRDLVKLIAMDIGKEVVAYIEYMYPEAIKATSSTFKLSVRNCVHNQIMAALEVNEEGAIIARLADRKK